ncbi:hypothetical protein [Lysobacter sp. CA199]|uniref:hypothetical protein n=1 Tax=Lysobacter sp. CA199 TaxID=3455608 RepID=UPI003F8D76B7
MDGARARMQRARLRQPASPPRDPALRETVRRLSALALHGGYGSQSASHDAVSAALAAAAAAADAAAAAAAATPPGATPAHRKESRAPEPRVSVAQARTAAQQLREILQRRPMPGVDEIGADGVEALWSGIYRDRDDSGRQLRLAEAFLETQRRMPGAGGYLIREAMERVDQLRLAEGRLQRYGTQFDIVDGKVAPRPVESAQAAEAYRSEFERMPLALEACLRGRLNSPRAFVPEL